MQLRIFPACESNDTHKQYSFIAWKGGEDMNIRIMACEGNADEKLDVKGLNEVIKVIKGSK